MILATYQLSSAVWPDKIIDAGLCNEGDLLTEQIVTFQGGRDGECRCSLRDHWGVIYFHTCGRMDIEIDFIRPEDLLDILRRLATKLFVRMTLVQPLGMVGHLPGRVMPGEEPARREN